jgi:hypothetical protein
MKNKKERSMENIEESQKELYLKKFRAFGEDPRSLSWNDKKSQFLRFKRIAELFKYENSQLGHSHSEPFTVHEIGCGLAHFKDFLDSSGYNCTYSGSDIVADFIEHNRRKYPQCRFFLQSISDNYDEIDDAIRNNDYYCLSGTFYTMENNDIKDWESFVFKAILSMFRMAKKGIAFNFLTSHADFYDGKLYYADPKEIIDWCIKNLSRFVVLLHDIPLYEFTVVVYREEFVKEKFPEYSMYFK